MNENQLIIELSRLKNNLNIPKLKKISLDEINWEYFNLIANKNKVFEICISNLNYLGLEEYIPENIKKEYKRKTKNNLKQFETNKHELKKLIETSEINNIKIVPVKGSYLSEYLYGDPSIRKTNDVDVLVSIDDTRKITEILLDQGFSNKKYDKLSKEFVDYDRLTIMKYKMTMYNLLPFVKIIGEQIIKFDISFALDFNRSTASVVKDMLEDVVVNKNEIPTMSNESYLIHLLIHNYREATNASWIELNKDITLRKICDIREFIRELVTDKELNNVISYMLRVKQKEALIFNMYCIKVVYNDEFAVKILNNLSINERNINSYFKIFDNSRKKSHLRQKSLLDTIFSLNNLNELR